MSDATAKRIERAITASSVDVDRRLDALFDCLDDALLGARWSDADALLRRMALYWSDERLLSETTIVVGALSCTHLADDHLPSRVLLCSRCVDLYTAELGAIRAQGLLGGLTPYT